jgi:hypothetical protein
MGYFLKASGGELDKKLLSLDRDNQRWEGITGEGELTSIYPPYPFKGGNSCDFHCSG